MSWTYAPRLTSWMLAVAICGVVAPARADDVRERLNKIFYWHLSDDLKLSTKQEKEMIQIIQDIQKRRQVALDERDAALELLRKLGRAPQAGALESALARYRKSLVDLGGLDVEEYERLKTLFGAETLARYYVVREEVMGRVREALKQAEQKR